MKTFSIEEFAARRRERQVEVEEELRGFTERALEMLREGLESWDEELIRAIDELFLSIYEEEGGTGVPIRELRRYRSELREALSNTTRDSDPELMSTWLSTATLNAATSAAVSRDPEFLVMEWVTMEDEDVRLAHREVEGQQRPPGEMFEVGGEEMPYPGYPGVSPSLWINCRCALAPAVPNEEASFQMEPEGEVMDENENEVTGAWHGVLAPEGKWSGDGRRFSEGALTYRDLPLPLTWQKASSDGHSGSVVVARIDHIERVGDEHRASGVWLKNVEAEEVVSMIDEFGRFGVSIDADDAEFEFDDESGKITFTSARIASASIVAIPAFAEAFVANGEAPEGFFEGTEAETEASLTKPEGEESPALGLVAAADSIKAPAAWFKNPELDGPTHLTVTEEGRVFGHIAVWGQCHIGYDGVCINPPFSKSNYAYFATGSVLLDNGEVAHTGSLSVGGGHAGGNLRWRAAIEHYDSTSAAVADISVGEDAHGIWCAGWVRPGATDEQIVALRASKVSGDWREVVRGSEELELVAALAVNVPGFPVRVAASNGRQISLVAAGMMGAKVEDESFDLDEFAERVAAAIENRQKRRERVAALTARLGGSN